MAEESADRSAYPCSLVGGFFSCILIREMNFLFDVVQHGAWLWFALALRQPRQILPSLAALVFSRLFGMHQLWQQLMLDGYNRVVKNMAEESSELFGYSLCLVASLRYLWQTPARRWRRHAPAVAW